MKKVMIAGLLALVASSGIAAQVNHGGHKYKVDKTCYTKSSYDSTGKRVNCATRFITTIIGGSPH